MRCSHCGAERLKNITVQGESCTCKQCGAEFTVQTSADSRSQAVVFCSRLPQPGRGGKRKGAGRKPGKSGPKGSLTLWLSADVAAFLETFGQERSATVEKMLRKSAAFKAWQKSQAPE
jgi:hypothetical protein